MATETLSNKSFPATQQDVARLKQTALDAAADLGSTAATHATKAKGELKVLAGHLQEEGTAQLNEAKGKLRDLADSARAYAAENPLTCIGVALAVGFLVGVSRRACSRS